MSDPLAPLRPRFQARCAEDLEKISALSPDAANVPALIEICHRLAGVAGSFGARGLSKAASAVELAALSGAWPDKGVVSALILLLESEARPGQ
jgi:HPt (histidine-containing phosphotransfer) domain-containing protein